MPTPLSVVSAFIEVNSREIVLPAYQARMFAELTQILDAIPHDQLSIQWETVFELMMLEGHKLWKYHGEDLDADIRRHFALLLDEVPADVECGFHLCYGDAGHKHFLEPPNTGVMTSVANKLVADASRQLDFLHIPVPRDRDDLAYFEPLRDLNLDDQTDLYLGLVHQTGGPEGTIRRIETARKIVGRFGIATECGFGRRPADSIPGLLKQHSELSQTLVN
jgi:methionine synthase II (cobalamin-independent)